MQRLVLTVAILLALGGIGMVASVLTIEHEAESKKAPMAVLICEV
jgi:hypothetical protein